jgi:hypothetical protein
MAIRLTMIIKHPGDYILNKRIANWNCRLLVQYEIETYPLKHIRHIKGTLLARD